jgi:glutamyl-tRNA synthetase
VRTALFNWLYARHTGGAFVLRIEDTDTARNTEQSLRTILDGLRWLGLDWDEGPEKGGGFGPYFQSQRADIYRRRIQELKDKGMAYERDGAVRFKMSRQPIEVTDLIAGSVVRPLNETEMLDPDFVIVRSDGNPVFHLVNVVDDIEMKITHVIRGEDHLSNTPKHIALFRAFGVESPNYAHIPMILNPDDTKMSKSDPDPAKGAADRRCHQAFRPATNPAQQRPVRFFQIDVDEWRVYSRHVAGSIHRIGAAVPEIRGRGSR